MPRSTVPPALKDAFAFKGIAVWKRGRGGRYYVQKWPRQRKTLSSSQQEQIAGFVTAQAMIKQLPASQVGIAYQLTQGTGMYPRDLLMSAMAGNAVEIEGDATSTAPRAKSNAESLLSNLNAVKRFFSMNCGTTWYVWFETFFRAVPSLIYGFTTFSKRDILKMRLGISYRCGVRQLLRDVIKGTPVADSEGLAFFIAIDEVISKVLWWWFIAELVSEFAAKWVTLVEAEEACIPPTNCQAEGSQSGQDTIAIGTWHRVAWTMSTDPCHLVTSSTIKVASNQSIGFGFNIYAMPALPPTPTRFYAWDWRVTEVETGTVVSSGSVTKLSDTGDNNVPIFPTIQNNFLPTSVTYQAEFKNNGPAGVLLPAKKGSIVAWQQLAPSTVETKEAASDETASSGLGA